VAGKGAEVIHILLVDDHALVRAGIRLVLDRQPDMVVVGEACTGADAVALALRIRPTVVILDVGLPDMDGIDALERIKAHAPQVRVLLLSGVKNGQQLQRALRAGALGYVLKEARAADLVRAVRKVARGELVVAWPEDAASIEVLLHAARYGLQPPRHSTLTEREREVLRLVARGYSNPEIAHQLGISPKTVDTHRTHVMAKLDLHSRADVTRYALQQGYLSVA
jgi:two-component system response regulator NreC